MTMDRLVGERCRTRSLLARRRRRIRDDAVVRRACSVVLNETSTIWDATIRGLCDHPSIYSASAADLRPYKYATGRHSNHAAEETHIYKTAGSLKIEPLYRRNAWGQPQSSIHGVADHGSRREHRPRPDGALTRRTQSFIDYRLAPKRTCESSHIEMPAPGSAVLACRIDRNRIGMGCPPPIWR